MSRVPNLQEQHMQEGERRVSVREALYKATLRARAQALLDNGHMSAHDRKFAQAVVDGKVSLPVDAAGRASTEDVVSRLASIERHAFSAPVTFTPPQPSLEDDRHSLVAAFRAKYPEFENAPFDVVAQYMDRASGYKSDEEIEERDTLIDEGVDVYSYFNRSNDE